MCRDRSGRRPFPRWPLPEILTRRAYAVGGHGRSRRCRWQRRPSLQRRSRRPYQRQSRVPRHPAGVRDGYVGGPGRLESLCQEWVSLS
jgi:hypothetical protein